MILDIPQRTVILRVCNGLAKETSKPVVLPNLTIMNQRISAVTSVELIGHSGN